jgi:RNA polymerase sigma factor (sigma-70 family)
MASVSEAPMVSLNLLDGTLSVFPDNPTSEQILKLWDRDIRRASDIAARSFLRQAADRDDFAQDARLRVLRSYKSDPTKSEAFIRTVIKNSTRNSARSEITDLEKTTALETSEEAQNATAFEDRATDHFVVAAVRRFISSLPENLQAVYKLIFQDELTQRDAANRMGLSQPRIAELKRELLRRGKKELVHLA